MPGVTRLKASLDQIFSVKIMQILYQLCVASLMCLNHIDIPFYRIPPTVSWPVPWKEACLFVGHTINLASNWFPPSYEQAIITFESKMAIMKVSFTSLSSSIHYYADNCFDENMMNMKYLHFKGSSNCFLNYHYPWWFIKRGSSR